MWDLVVARLQQHTDDVGSHRPDGGGARPVYIRRVRLTPTSHKHLILHTTRTTLTTLFNHSHPHQLHLDNNGFCYWTVCLILRGTWTCVLNVALADLTPASRPPRRGKPPRPPTSSSRTRSRGMPTRRTRSPSRLPALLRCVHVSMSFLCNMLTHLVTVQGPRCLCRCRAARGGLEREDQRSCRRGQGQHDWLRPASARACRRRDGYCCSKHHALASAQNTGLTPSSSRTSHPPSLDPPPLRLTQRATPPRLTTSSTRSRPPLAPPSRPRRPSSRLPSRPCSRTSSVWPARRSHT